MDPSRRVRRQPVANATLENGPNNQIGNRRQPVAIVRARLVRRRSTVRGTNRHNSSGLGAGAAPGRKRMSTTDVAGGSTCSVGPVLYPDDLWCRSNLTNKLDAPVRNRPAHVRTRPREHPLNPDARDVATEPSRRQPLEELCTDRWYPGPDAFTRRQVEHELRIHEPTLATTAIAGQSALWGYAELPGAASGDGGSASAYGAMSVSSAERTR
jgi:hypothetical protein